jgi:amino acid transporter
MELLEEARGTTVVRHHAKYPPAPTWKRWFVGSPLATAEAPHQTVGKLIGLAVFASDALSSTAYATQEMMVILVAAGFAALTYSIPISIAIVILLSILTFSYQQTIHAYPGGGGAYIVARDNLGELPAQAAAAALLTDYVLTVAVSISSGVAQIVSAFSDLYNERVWIAVGMVMFIMLINLRGVRESGIAFAAPTYFFIVMMLITLCIGIYRLINGSLGLVVDPPMDLIRESFHPITLFLILRAFASGTAAVTGVEAISNGITAFKEPRSRNAGITLIWMSIILGSFLLAITFLAHDIGALPSENETIISQLGRTVLGGRGGLYLALITATTVILIMACNTAFADFPRLSALAARDGFLPRQLAFRGDRLVFSRGIVTLTIISCGLVIAFQASVTSLIPLYAIGVFLSFTLSQAGMARRWWKIGHLQPGTEIQERGSTLSYEANWEVKMIINGLGAVCTFVVMIIFAATKFSEGAWVVVLIIPLMVITFSSIHRHYSLFAGHLSLDYYAAPPRIIRHRVIIPLAGVHRGTLAALRYARTLSDDITAVHVSVDPEESQRLQQKWEQWGDGVRLVMLESPYRIFLQPLLDYIEKIDDQVMPNEMITVVVPRFVSSKYLTSILHTQTADTLRKMLLNRKEIVIMEVPYQVEG